MILIRALFFFVLMFFPIADLTMAYLYHETGTTSVSLLRYMRDIASLTLAAIGFFYYYMPFQLRLSYLGYGLLIVLYSLFGFISGRVPLDVLIPAIGVLLIPFTLMLAGFCAIRSERDMGVMLKMLIAYAVATTLFGMWEVEHTEFWVVIVDLGQYIWDVRGSTTGFQKTIFLPWNYSSAVDGTRRAAGLLAAPLAQGAFLAVVGLLAFAYLRGRSLLLAVGITMLCVYGVYMTETRGALAAYGIGAVIYFLLPSQKSRVGLNVVILILTMGVMLNLAYKQIEATLELRDHSSLGHIDALRKNLESLPGVAVIGDGIGAAGAQAAAVDLEVEGGGEGALFSIAYQLGLPGTFVFMWFYWRLISHLLLYRREDSRTGELARSLLGLSIGIMPSMITSEHILTFSGMAAFWLSIGGFVGYTSRTRALELSSTPTATS